MNSMIGKILDGRYEVISFLGKGSFGTTYLAIDRRMPDKDKCVVKHFTPMGTDANTLLICRRLFDTEAQVLNRLGAHDLIPRLLAHFEEEEEFYLVEEYIEGNDLSHEIKAGDKWSEIEVIALLQNILKALEFVHENNVIHRDIKPSNLIRRQKDNKVVLIDFGAVKQIGSQTLNQQGKTTSTVAIGTPGYMPSEQTQGQPRPCSDIYAVGIMGIQALTGIEAIRLKKDTQSGEIVWRDQAQVSQQLAEILEKMVKYDFRQRYHSATEVLQALNKLKFNKLKKKKIILGLGTTIICSLIIIGFIFINQNNRLQPYNNAIYGITLKYPQTWKKDESVKPDRITGDLAQFVSPSSKNSDASQGKIRLIVQELPEDIKTLEQFNSFYVDEIKQSFQNAKIIEENKSKLSNLDARQVVDTGSNEGRNVKRFHVFTVKNSKAYIITYTADAAKYPNYYSTVQKIISSVEIK